MTFIHNLYQIIHYYDSWLKTVNYNAMHIIEKVNNTLDPGQFIWLCNVGLSKRNHCSTLV